MNFVSMQDKSQKMGIALMKTSTHPPESNGVEERKDRTLMEMAKQMLEKACKWHFFGGGAIYRAICISKKLLHE